MPSRGLLTCACVVLLAACGGGGGSGQDLPVGPTGPTGPTGPSGLPVVTAYVNGTVTALEDSLPPDTRTTGKSLKVKDGDLVRLELSKPVPFVNETQSGASAFDSSSTSTSWEGTIQYGLSTPGGEGCYFVAFVTGATSAFPVLRVAICVRG